MHVPHVAHCAVSDSGPSCLRTDMFVVQFGRELWHVKLVIASDKSASGELCVNTEIEQKSLSLFPCYAVVTCKIK